MALSEAQIAWLRDADSLYDDEIKLYHARAAEAIKHALDITPTIWSCRRSRRRCNDLVLTLTDLRVKILACSVRWNLQLNACAQLFPKGDRTAPFERGLERTANGLQSARDATQDAESVVSLRASQTMDLWTNLLAWLAIGITVVLGGISIWVTLYPRQ